MTTREEYAKALDKVLTDTHSTLFLRGYYIIREKEKKICIEDLLDRVIMPMVARLDIDRIEQTEYRTLVNDNGRFYLK